MLINEVIQYLEDNLSLDITASKLRSWEEQGLIKCTRQDNDYRDFDDENVARISKLAMLSEPIVALDTALYLIEHPEDDEYRTQYLNIIKKKLRFLVTVLS